MNCLALMPGELPPDLLRITSVRRKAATSAINISPKPMPPLSDCGVGVSTPGDVVEPGRDGAIPGDPPGNCGDTVGELLLGSWGLIVGAGELPGRDGLIPKLPSEGVLSPDVDDSFFLGSDGVGKLGVTCNWTKWVSLIGELSDRERDCKIRIKGQPQSFAGCMSLNTCLVDQCHRDWSLIFFRAEKYMKKAAFKFLFQNF